MQVTVDGQPVTTLPGATDAQIEVLAPTTVLTTPGAYRLSVVDPLRRVGDGFVVTSAAGIALATSGAPPGELPPNGQMVAPDGATLSTVDARAASAARVGNGAGSLAIEDAGPPYRTALGWHALVGVTTGLYNTGLGFEALVSNTSGCQHGHRVSCAPLEHHGLPQHGQWLRGAPRQHRRRRQRGQRRLGPSGEYHRLLQQRPTACWRRTATPPA